MERIAGIVILYNPDEKATFNNIMSYAGHVEKLFIADNSAVASTFLKTSLQQIGREVIYIHDGENKGISSRLNEVASLAIADGFDWLLTMDQDSSFEGDNLPAYLRLFQDFPKNDVAVFGVNYRPVSFPISDIPVEVPSMITSGSLLNLTLYQKIGKYDEALFIDFVDSEYCYRATELHYKIIQFRNILLVHAIGYIQYGRSLKNFKLTPRILHSPVRAYYIIRNGLYLIYRYPHLPLGAKEEIKKVMWLMKNNVLYHHKRWQVIKNIIKGFNDFFINKMGKLK